MLLQKKNRILFFLVLTYLYVGAQKVVNNNKPIIDSLAVANWPGLSSPSITSDGKYISYQVYNMPLGEQSCVLQAIDCSWKSQLPSVTGGFFLCDNKRFAFLKSDTLVITPLGNRSREQQFLKVTNFFSLADNRFIYFEQDIPGRNTNKNKTWIVYDVLKNQTHLIGYGNVQKFWIDNEKMNIFIESTSSSEDIRQLYRLDISKNRLEMIWSDSLNVQLENVQMTSNLGELMFISNKLQKRSIWIYSSGMAIAKKIIDDDMQGVPKNYSIGHLEKYTGDHNYVLLELILNKNNLDNGDHKSGIDVDIFSYSSIALPWNYANASQLPESVIGVLDIKRKVISILARWNEQWIRYSNELSGNKIIVSNSRDLRDSWWPSGNDSLWLVSLKDGSRKLMDIPINSNRRNKLRFYVSPDSRYIVFIDYENSGYYSYDTETESSRMISTGVGSEFHDEFENYAGYHEPFTIAGWRGDKPAVLVYGQYDIWQLPLDGKSEVINLTTQNGKNRTLKFRFVEESNRKVFYAGEKMLLTVFQTNTKYNGFYKITLNVDAKPSFLTLGAYTYFKVRSQMPHFLSFSNGMKPIKAKRANIWIVSRQSASQSPNLFVTKDFRIFKPLTNLYPEVCYNWLTTEVINYKQTDGSSNCGVLYKPENFNRNKKYPVIINYYERLSHRAYEFPTPDFSGGNLNVAWFVSRGYLVFTPDISYSTASESGMVIGDCVTNAIVGATNYLSSLDFIDSKHIGLQGHSFGGGETLELITRSNLFAAACAASPHVSDQITYTVGFAWGNGTVVGGNFSAAEVGHEKIGATIWQRPDLYARASPILRAEKVTTPLLLMCNPKDESVDYNQGAMMFLALRRLQKKCWMLQYKNGSHALNGNESVDFTKRLTSFFDYFLKGESPPSWLLEN